MRSKRKLVLFVTIPSVLILSITASLYFNFGKTLNKNLNEPKQEKSKDIQDEFYKLSDEQLEVLKKMNKTVEEALFENDLELRKELSISVPEKKESYTDAKEFSQYISYLLFAFHKGEIDAATFYDEISPYLHEDFLKDLPESRENKIKTFDTIQKLYREQLSAEIEKYTITNLNKESRFGETYFYRKYTLKNGEEVYSITELKRDKKGAWKLLDDSPAPPYQVQIDNK